MGISTDLVFVGMQGDANAQVALGTLERMGATTLRLQPGETAPFDAIALFTPPQITPRMSKKYLRCSPEELQGVAPDWANHTKWKAAVVRTERRKPSKKSCSEPFEEALKTLAGLYGERIRKQRAASGKQFERRFTPAGGRYANASTEGVTLNWGGMSTGYSSYVCHVDEAFRRRIEMLTTDYFAAVERSLLAVGNGHTPELLSRMGAPAHQESYLRFRNVRPGLVRLDLGYTPDGKLGVYEFQPRPGGMGMLIELSERLGVQCPLVPQMQTTINERRINDKPPVFMVCEQDRVPAFPGQPPYLAEFTRFAEAVGGRVIAEQGLGDVSEFGSVYVRGTFHRSVPAAVRQFEEGGIPFLVPPGYLWHFKAWMSLPDLADRDGILRTIPVATLDRSEIESYTRATEKERSQWVIKPSYGFGAAEVWDGRAAGRTRWTGMLNSNLNILQQSFLHRTFVPELGDEANFILRIYVTESGGRYHWAGGFWNARIHSIRVHGATDAVFGLLDVVEKTA